MFLEKKGKITENNEGERKLWIDYITKKKKTNFGINELYFIRGDTFKCF
jgi:hypothetical protein